MCPQPFGAAAGHWGRRCCSALCWGSEGRTLGEKAWARCQLSLEVLVGSVIRPGPLIHSFWNLWSWIYKYVYIMIYTSVNTCLFIHWDFFRSLFRPSRLWLSAWFLQVENHLLLAGLGKQPTEAHSSLHARISWMHPPPHLHWMNCPILPLTYCSLIPCTLPLP